MDLSAIIKAVLDPLTDRSESGGIALQSGDRLSGKVLKLEADGRVLMDFGQFRAHAHLQWSVQPDQIMDLEVVETGSPLKLRALSDLGSPPKLQIPHTNLAQLLPEPDQNRLTALLEHVAKPPLASRLPQRILAAFTELRAVFQPLAMAEGHGVGELVQRLRQTIEHSGLLFEKNLAETLSAGTSTHAEQSKWPGHPMQTILSKDIKARLLQLKFFLAETNAHPEMLTDLTDKELVFMRRNVDRMLAHVQSQQDRIMARLGDNDPVLEVTHQLFLENQKKPVQLKLYYPKKERRQRSPGHYRLAILLNMDRLGPVRVDLAMLEDGLEIGFFVKNESAHDLLEAHCEQLESALHGNFRQIKLTVRVSEKKITQFQHEDPTDLASGRIDIQI